MSKGYNPDWDIRLAEGKAREQFFTGILLDKTKHFLLIESKGARKSQQYGTVFIEHWDRGHPSGISVTKADWWVIEVSPDVFVLLRTERLRKLWQRVMDEDGETEGGDDLLALGAKVPRDWLINVQDWE